MVLGSVETMRKARAYYLLCPGFPRALILVNSMSCSTAEYRHMITVRSFLNKERTNMVLCSPEEARSGTPEMVR